VCFFFFTLHTDRMVRYRQMYTTFTVLKRKRDERCRVWLLRIASAIVETMTTVELAKYLYGK